MFSLAQNKTSAMVALWAQMRTLDTLQSAREQLKDDFFFVFESIAIAYRRLGLPKARIKPLLIGPNKLSVDSPIFASMISRMILCLDGESYGEIRPLTASYDHDGAKYVDGCDVG